MFWFTLLILLVLGGVLLAVYLALRFWRVSLPIVLVLGVLLLGHAGYQTHRAGVAARRIEAAQAQSTPKTWQVENEPDPATGVPAPRYARVASDDDLCELIVEERLDGDRLTSIYCPELEIQINRFTFTTVGVKFDSTERSESMALERFVDDDEHDSAYIPPDQDQRLDIFQVQVSEDFLQYDEFIRRIASSQRLALELEFRGVGNHWIPFSLRGSRKALTQIGALPGVPTGSAREAKVPAASTTSNRETHPSDTNWTTFLASEEGKIRPSCKERWPSDFSAEALCVDMQTDGFREVRRFVVQRGIQSGGDTATAGILDSCVEKWTGHGGRVDWSAAALCVRMQMDGYERLNRGQ